MLFFRGTISIPLDEVTFSYLDSLRGSPFLPSKKKIRVKIDFSCEGASYPGNALLKRDYDKGATNLRNTNSARAFNGRRAFCVREQYDATRRVDDE